MVQRTPCRWASEAENVQDLTHCNIITILMNFVHFLVYIFVTVIIRNHVGTLDKVTIEDRYIAT
jgi:hypothetical protein